MNSSSNTEYIPYGEEWEKELMKLPKKFLIDMVRKANASPDARHEAAEGEAKAQEYERLKHLRATTPAQTPPASEGEEQYYHGLTKNYGRSQPYHYTGPKCVAGCVSFAHYETKHDPKCPFYKESLSEKYDEIESRLSKLQHPQTEDIKEKAQELADAMYLSPGEDEIFIRGFLIGFEYRNSTSGWMPQAGQLQQTIAEKEQDIAHWKDQASKEQANRIAMQGEVERLKKMTDSVEWDRLFNELGYYKKLANEQQEQIERLRGALEKVSNAEKLWYAIDVSKNALKSNQ